MASLYQNSQIFLVLSQKWTWVINYHGGDFISSYIISKHHTHHQTLSLLFLHSSSFAASILNYNENSVDEFLVLKSFLKSKSQGEKYYWVGKQKNAWTHVVDTIPIYIISISMNVTFLNESLGVIHTTATMQNSMQIIFSLKVWCVVLRKNWFTTLYMYNILYICNIKHAYIIIKSYNEYTKILPSHQDRVTLVEEGYDESPKNKQRMNSLLLLLQKTI